MSFNNFKQKVNKFLRKFGNMELTFCKNFSRADFEADFLLGIAPEKCALKILQNEGFKF